MILTLEDVRQKIDQLVSCQVSRESVADFASKALMAKENGSLQIEPQSEKLLVWRAIVYLSGVDLRDSPETYLHNIEDFREFRRLDGI